ncbi:DUF2834 domain-containing protein [Candidatus Binatus sp.]|uniref:DUF2834 domain-containing protein n=1 Tax=Candidatus Binatus sp. TaxID=2811406 RepID=UPI003C5BF5CA
MSNRLIVLLLIIAGFGVLTTRAVMDAGYVGLFMSSFGSLSGTQIFFDLVILGVLACIWMVNDARERGLVAWPFILITLLAGSFGPLLYLVVRELRSPAPDSARARAATRATS